MTLRLLHLRTSQRAQLLEITSELEGLVRESGVVEGILVAQSLHTTAGLTINENADPDVVHDLRAKLERLIPKDETFYRHAEGNSDSHLKTSLFGPSLTVIISDGKLVLGRWQGIYFCDWDGPRERQVAVQILVSD
ncbi:MAG: secondary thiamine-phosphate synthase enzyme YjbQ [Gemmatimonadetes bacterium]|nr:secondary thiamine-phosphate synthase enzyme YjbQ [Gemmatimonadota bacterium]